MHMSSILPVMFTSDSRDLPACENRLLLCDWFQCAYSSETERTLPVFPSGERNRLSRLHR